MKVKAEDIYPIGFLDAPAFTNNSGDIAFAFVYTGAELLTSTKERLLALNEVMEAGFDFLDEGFVIHQQSVNIKSTYLGNDREHDHFISNSFYNYYDGKRYWKRVTYVFVIKVNGKGKDRTYSEARVFSRWNSTKRTNDIDGIKRKVLSFSRHLKASGISLTPIASNDTIHKLYQGYIGAYEEGVFNDLSFSDDGIVIGADKKLKCMAINNDNCLPLSMVPYRENKTFSTDDVKLYSDFTYAVDYGLKANHIVNTIIFLDDQQEWKKELEYLSKRLRSLSLLSRENAKMSKGNDAFLEDTLKGKGKRIVRAHMNVMYWADSDNELDAIETDLKSAFNELKMTPNISNYRNQKSLFFSCMPGNAGTMAFRETFLTHANIGAAMLSKESIIDRSKGKPSVNGLLTTDRVSGIPSHRDAWFAPYKNKDITARNSCRIGKTGGGKTVGVINDLFQYWQMGFYISCIDIGGSLEVICKMVGGNYIVYKEGMSLGINPYSLQNNVLSANKLEYLTNFTSMLWRPGVEMDPTQSAALEQVIIKAYDARKTDEEDHYTSGFDATNYGFKDFYKWVEANQLTVNSITRNNKEFFDVDSFLLATGQFYDGKYSKLFTSKEGIDLLDVNNRFTVFEMDNVIDHPTLFPIFAMLITHLTTEVMWNRQGINKIFWFEEAWKVALKKGMAPFFIYLLKTMRKFDGGFGVSIQEVGNMDVPGSNLMETFLNNVDVWYFTYHPEAEAESAARRMRWIKEDKPTDLRYDLLRSIKNDVRGEYPYMETLSIIGKDVKVTRAMLSPEQVAAFMSDKNDKAELFPFVEKNGGDYEKGITDYVASKKKAKQHAAF